MSCPIPIFYIKNIDMKIICFDQATKITGYSFFEDKELKDYGIFQVPEKDPYLARMSKMYSLIKEYIIKISPDIIVIEDVQVQRNNIAVFGQLSQMQGVIIALAYEFEKEFIICPASTWKSFCKIEGKNRKEQKPNAIKFVQREYNISASEDAAEAICIGYWSINTIRNEKVRLVDKS